MLEWGAILQKGSEALAAAVVKSAVEQSSKGFRDRKPYESLDLKRHLEFAFERCTKIKTILSRDTPAPLLEQYVNLYFSIGEESIDDYELIDRVWSNKRVVVNSIGGGGKSMFMRYL
jgi:hypothetical protein